MLTKPLKFYSYTFDLYSDYFISIATDADECAGDFNDCHDNATCEDLVGSYRCYCDPGFSGDGTSCSGEGLQV